MPANEKTIAGMARSYMKAANPTYGNYRSAHTTPNEKAIT
jgi:hypothetical protein